MIISKDKFIVSFYKNKFSRYPKQVELYKILLTHEFKDLVAELRKLKYHSEEYDEFKMMKMPIILGNGTCNIGQSKTAENIHINPTIIIDVDLQDNPELLTKYSLEDWKFELINQQDAIMVLKSCGGYGLMIVHRLSDSVDKSTYIKYFKKLEKRYKEKYGIVIDASCKNVNRPRYVTFDDSPLYNQIYSPLELTEEDMNNNIEKYNSNNSNLVYTYNSDTFNLEDSKGPFYFGHSSKHTQTIGNEEIESPLISETIHTLLCLYDKDTVKNIWRHPKFYSKNPSDNIRWIENYKVTDENGNDIPINEWKPNLKVIKFLNEYCGFNIEYDIKSKNVIQLDDSNDFIDSIIGKNETIVLNENEYMYDRKDDILKYLSTYHTNMIICPPGRGKTTFFNNLYTNEKKKILIIQPYKSIVKSKYKGIECKLCVEKQKIEPDFEYVITHYDNFCHAYEHNKLGVYDYLVIDESHLIGTQNFRANIMLKTIKYIELYKNDHLDTKVVIMTGTPSNETTLFSDIKTFVNIKYNEKRFVGIEYLNAQTYKSTKTEKTGNNEKQEVDIYENDIIKTLVHLSNIAKNEGRKIYVYWGTGSIYNDELYQQTANALNNLNIAVYHKRNEGSEDLEYIRENEAIGKFDGLMSSCYFSVGCDLNDEQSAQIIIIGNNTYQEDAQVIGRFRKSKNIKVTILVNSYNIQKYDCDKELETEINKTNQLSKSRNSKHTSLIYKLSSDEDIEKKAYINVSKKYFSDIKRKFEYYKSQNWFLFNKYNIEDNEYEITDLNGISYIYLIDIETNVVNEIKKARKHHIKELKKSIWHNIKMNKDYDLDYDYEKCVKFPNLQDWIDAIRVFQKYYDMSELIKLDSDIIYSLSKKQLNTLIKWSIRYKENDEIENYIIEKILYNKDELLDLKKNNVTEYIKKIGIYYIIWCSAYDKKKDFSFCNYDLNNYWTYPVYNQWKENIESIIYIDDNIRSIIMKDNYTKEIIDDFTLQFFNLSNESSDNSIDYIKNKYLNTNDKKRFLEFICRKHKKKEICKETGKIGGKISSPKKKCVITDKFKHTDKYNLKVGQEFESASALSEYTNKTNKTISQWRDKGWIN